jgi:hypothetical protein
MFCGFLSIFICVEHSGILHLSAGRAAGDHSTLLPLRGNKKQEFGLWVAGATHVGNLLPRSGNKNKNFGLWATPAAHVGEENLYDAPV